MRPIRWYGPSVVLLVTTLLVMILGPQMARKIAWAQADGHIQLVKDTLSNNLSLAEMSDAFRMVAQAVEPSVVHVSVKQRARAHPQRHPNEELLKRFFGPNKHWGNPGDGEDDSKQNDSLDRYNVPQVLGNGSGWVYDTDGHIITNYHVVKGADVITVRFHDGTEREAQVVGKDPKTDIAVLEIDDNNLHPATLADEPVEQGDIVFAFGSPFRFEFSMSQGIVSGKGRQLGILNRRGSDGSVIAGYENFIQTDAAINPGNSGGPLVNIYGQVVGMNTAIATRTGAYNGLGFAIPVPMVHHVVEQLINTGKVSRGYLGVFITDLDPKLGRTFGFEGKGVLVENPIEDSPADQAGIKRGDIITKINSQAVNNADDLRQRVADYPPGTTLSIELYRMGEELLTIDVTIGELPDRIASASGMDSGGTDPANDEGIELLRKLGLQSVTAYTEELANRLDIDFTPGVIVKSVRPNSAAAAVGVAKKNIITAVMGTPVKSVQDLVDALSEHDLTKGVRVSILDDNLPRFVLLELPEQ